MSSQQPLSSLSEASQQLSTSQQASGASQQPLRSLSGATCGGTLYPDSRGKLRSLEAASEEPLRSLSGASQQPLSSLSAASQEPPAVAHYIQILEVN